MDTRATIDRLLDQAYDARRREDVAAVTALFTDGGRFMANGAAPATGRSEQVLAIKGLFDAFALVEFHQHCRIVDPPRAVVHWRGKFRAQNGKIGDTDVLDLFEVQDGKIVSLTTFFDTAYAAALSAPA